MTDTAYEELRSRGLTEREAFILAAREQAEPMSYAEIGRRFGIGREWTRKLADRARAKLAEGPGE